MLNTPTCRDKLYKITIVTDLLPPFFKKHRYMHDGYWYDYLGQILLQRGYDIPDKCRTPADMKQFLPPFTFNCRGVQHNTKLTMDILNLDYADEASRPQQLVELLKPHGHEVKFQ